jgi:dienelactone hydrolase
MRFILGPPETDSIFTTAKRHEAEAILAKSGLMYQINLFSGVEHGFAVRGDPSKFDAKFAKEQSFLQAVTWFKTML